MARAPKTQAKVAAAPSANANGDGTGTPERSKRGGKRDGAGRKRKSGGDRPSTFSEAIGNEICAKVAEGETLTSLCEREGYPCRETVWRWMQQFPAFEDQYLRARVFSQQLRGDEAIDIARTEEDIARARLMIDARLRIVGRLASQYAGLIQARTPEAQPVDIVSLIQENRKKLDALIEEVGWERAERMREDALIERARNPDERLAQTEIGQRILRGNQRVAEAILQERKKSLLTAAPVNKEAI